MGYIHLILSYIITISDAAKILAVFPTPSISHHNVFQPFVQELASRRHEIVMITPFPRSRETGNIREINIHNISYSLWRETVSNKFGKSEYQTVRFKNGFEAQKVIFGKILENVEFKEIAHENFDLLLLEAWVRPLLALTHIFKAPVVTLSSLGILNEEYNLVGSPIHPILYPTCIQQKIHSQTLTEQLSELYQTFILHNMLEDVKKDDRILKSEYFKDVLSVSDLKNQVDMMILNIHPIWDQSRPLPLSLVYGGALHLKTVQDLPEV